MMKNDPLPRGEPEASGVDPRAVLDFLRAADETIDSVHGFMLMRHGLVVAEGAWKPYSLDRPHMLFSLSKSFTSTAIGFLVSEGRLSVDDRIVDLFPESAPKTVSPNLSAMRLRHLLSMNTGHDKDTTERIMRGRDPVKAFLALEVEHEPGSHFVYNSGASFVLSALVQKTSGKRLSSFLEPRLFGKLGIEGARWDRHPCGVDFGGWGLNIKVEDIARFGQLYLQKGIWKGERVVSEAWIDEATSKRSDNRDPEKPDPASDWQQGYGYQFWRCRHGFYRGDGAFGQLCVVMPEKDAVFAAVSGLNGINKLLDLVWDKLLPGLSDSPVSPNPAATRELGSFVQGLGLRPQKADAAGAGAAGAAYGDAGTGARGYRFEKNWAGLDFASFDFGADALEFAYRIKGRQAKGNGLDGPLELPKSSGKRKLRVGYGEWLEGVSYLDGGVPKPAFASGAWTAPDVFTMKLYAVETPFVISLEFRFEGERLKIAVGQNVNMGLTSFPPIEGVAR
jgi:CubicO group peptidase (beta-lactamase class C family)